MGGAICLIPLNAQPTQLPGEVAVEPTAEATARAEVGCAWHQEHGAMVARIDRARRVRDLCIILALLTAAAAATV